VRQVSVRQARGEKAAAGRAAGHPVPPTPDRAPGAVLPGAHGLPQNRQQRGGGSCFLRLSSRALPVALTIPPETGRRGGEFRGATAIGKVSPKRQSIPSQSLPRVSFKWAASCPTTTAPFSPSPRCAPVGSLPSPPSRSTSTAYRSKSTAFARCTSPSCHQDRTSDLPGRRRQIAAHDHATRRGIRPHR
jgi:hypothetical protein